MTASCPLCGGKWDIEDEHYELILRCGDEHDIRCGYCKRVITFVMDREAIELSYTIICGRYESLVGDLENEVKGLQEKLKKDFGYEGKP